MHIVFLSRLFYPHIGGVEKHVLKLSETLIKKGHSITVITEKYDTTLFETDEYQNIKIFRIPLGQKSERDKKWQIWKWIITNQKLLSEADIIHVHDVVFWLYPFKLLHPFKQIFTTFHGWEEIYPIPKKIILKRRFDAALSTDNICVGKYITKLYGIKAGAVTYGAVEPPKIKSNIKQENILLFIGRLNAGTGFSDCLEKYTALKDKLNWQLQIIGDGLLKNQIPKGAKYLGIVSNTQDYIGQAKYVYTTGFLGILESFIQKKIVLVSYANPVKQDYLQTHPMSKYLTVDGSLPTHGSQEAYNWARKQTWPALAANYENLWKKSQ